jgi:hypothetical protein
MSNTYHNNDAGGTAFDHWPGPPIDPLQPGFEHATPTPDGGRTRFQNSTQGGGRR